MTEIERKWQRYANNICSVLELEPRCPSKMIVRATIHTRFPTRMIMNIMMHSITHISTRIFVDCNASAYEHYYAYYG